MGQKVRPTGFRTGIMRPWRSTWYAEQARTSPSCCVEDVTIRAFIQKFLTNKKDRKEQRPAIADIRIERTRERVTVVVTSSRVGAIIGKKGEKIDKLTKALEKLTRRHIEVKTVEVTRPEIDAATHRRGHRGAAGEAGQLPPHDEAGHAAGDGGRGEGRQAATVRPARRGGNGPLREGHGRQHPALDAAVQGRVRVLRGDDAAGEHRHQGLGEPGRLPDRRHRRRDRRVGRPRRSAGRAAVRAVAAGSAVRGSSS